MKRSEFMIEMETYLIDKWGYDYKLTDNSLKDILDCIEHLGMSPPFSQKEFYRTWRLGGHGRVWEEEE